MQTLCNYSYLHAIAYSSGLVINSDLSMVLRVRKSSNCFAAVLEVFRIGGMLTSDLHLFALAINQFIGIAWPLKYKVAVFLIYIAACDVDHIGVHLGVWHFCQINQKNLFCFLVTVWMPSPGPLQEHFFSELKLSVVVFAQVIFAIIDGTLFARGIRLIAVGDLAEWVYLSFNDVGDGRHSYVGRCWSFRQLWSQSKCSYLRPRSPHSFHVFSCSILFHKTTIEEIPAQRVCWLIPISCLPWSFLAHTCCC